MGSYTILHVFLFLLRGNLIMQGGAPSCKSSTIVLQLPRSTVFINQTTHLLELQTNLANYGRAAPIHYRHIIGTRGINWALHILPNLLQGATLKIGDQAPKKIWINLYEIGDLGFQDRNLTLELRILRAGFPNSRYILHVFIPP